MTPDEEAAVQAAVAAAKAHEGTGVGHRPYPSYSAVDALEERLGPLDWSIGGRGFELLREVHRRVAGGPDLTGGEPELPWKAGAKYEDRYSPARRRLSRARA